MASTTFLQKAYLAYFGRPADASGLITFANVSEAQVIASFSASPESQEFFGSMPLLDQINTIYRNLFNRNAEPAGLTHWATKITSGELTLAAAAMVILSNAQNSDVTAVANKLAASAAFTAAVDTTAEILGYAGAAAIAPARAYLAAVSSDAATLTAATATAALNTSVATVVAAGTNGNNAGETFMLTTIAENITGTLHDDLITGVFGDAANTNNTFNFGDTINGGYGKDTLSLVATGTTATSASTSVAGVETINVLDTVGATLNATQISDAPAINFTGTVTGNTSTVTGAAKESVYGLSGKGNLTVDFASTSGAADLAKVALTAVGTSTAARSTINVSDGNTIEKVELTNTGSNFVTLTAGTKAALVTVKGGGTNDIDMSAVGAIPADTFTLDASTSTGANKFRLGSTLNTTDTIKGGTAADTVYADLNDGGLLSSTMTGVETADYTYNSVVGHNLANTTGLKTINMSNVDGLTSVINADASLASVNIQTMTSDYHDVSLSYRTGAEGDLRLSLGSTDITKDADFELQDVTVTRAKSVTIDVVGTHGHSADSVTINDAIDSFNINVAASADMNIDGIEFKGDVGAININVAERAYFSGYFGTGSNGRGDIGDVTMTVGAEGDGNMYIGQSGGYDIGNITLNALGQDASAGLFVRNSEAGDIGNINLNAVGLSADVNLYAGASGGSIGDINVNVDGRTAHVGMYVSAGDYEGVGSAHSPLVSVGDITVSVKGRSADFSGNVQVSGGDIGDISISVIGDHAYAYMQARAVGEVRDLTGDGGSGSVDDWVGGGNIGDISFSVEGYGASGYLLAASSGGNIGDITLSSKGQSASLTFYVSANSSEYSGAQDFVTIGDISLSIADGATSYGYIDSSGGNIGDVTVDVQGRDSSGYLNIGANDSSGKVGLQSGYVGGGNIGNITVSINGGGGTEFEIDALASGGNIGNVNWTQVGTSTSGNLNINSTFTSGGSLGGHGGTIGDVNITLSDGLNFDAFVGATVSVGDITLTAGNGVSASVNLSGGWASYSEDTRAIGDITVQTGNNSAVEFLVSGWGGDVGNVNLAAGQGSYMELHLDNVSGDIGYVSLTGGNTFASAYIEIDANSVGFVDASTWAGELQVYLAGTTIGTEIKTGSFRSYVTGTDAGDTIRLGTGFDEVYLDGNDETDTIYGFAYTKDVLDVRDSAVLNTLRSTNVATTLDNGEVQRLVDIAGNQDITTVAGLKAALVNGGEYDAIDITSNNSSLILTSASSASTKFFAFEAVDWNNDGDLQDADEIVLVGVVNSDAKLSDLTIDNFS